MTEIDEIRKELLERCKNIKETRMSKMKDWTSEIAELSKEDVVNTTETAILLGILGRPGVREFLMANIQPLRSTNAKHRIYKTIDVLNFKAQHASDIQAFIDSGNAARKTHRSEPDARKSTAGDVRLDIRQITTGIAELKDEVATNQGKLTDVEVKLDLAIKKIDAVLDIIRKYM